MKDEQFFERMAAEQSSSGARERKAPASLKARIYTAMVRAQQEEGPLAPLPETKKAGRGLCVFEELVAIAPVGETAKSLFPCTTCHARVLAEHLDNPPIWWPHCPYSEFKKT